MEPKNGTLTVHVPLGLVPSPLEARAARVVRAFLLGKNPRTVAAYAADLEDFRRFTGERSRELAAARLLGNGAGAANAYLLDYRAHLLERGLASATINRRISALRTLVRLARALGLVSWQIEVPNLVWRKP